MPCPSIRARTRNARLAAVAKTAGIRFGANHPLVMRVRAALANGDEHLNTITLSVWDRMGETMAWYAFRSHGDHDSMAGRVCVLKEAARQAAERELED